MALLGCAQSNNTFSSYYGGAGVSSTLSGAEVSPLLIETGKLGASLIIYRDEGFVLIGESYFEGDWESRTKAIDHAKDIGAEVILISSEYLGDKEKTYSSSIPVNSTSYHSGAMTTSDGYVNYSGTSTSSGSIKVLKSYVVGQYAQTAKFLVRQENATNE